MALLLIVAVIISKNMTSVGGAWKFLLTFASGAGAVWLLRWFWWRIHAWSEFSAMLTSAIVATTVSLLFKDWNYAQKLLTTVGISTAVWLIVTFLTAPVAQEHLRAFVEDVRPPSFGWKHLYTKFSIAEGESLSQGVVNALLGLVVFFSFNFALGHLLLKSKLNALLLFMLAVSSSFWLYKRITRDSDF